MNDRFTKYLDNYNHPCAIDLKAAYIEWKGKYPELPLPSCGPRTNDVSHVRGMQFVLDTGDRLLMLDLYPEGGEIFWRDRKSNDSGGDENPRKDWKETFEEKIPWFLCIEYTEDPEDRLWKEDGDR